MTISNMYNIVQSDTTTPEAKQLASDIITKANQLKLALQTRVE
jgi:hypothetical protein